MISPTQSEWYCVHTKSKSEHLAAAALRLLGVESYCPRLRFQRVTPRGKVWFTEALFPSYIFARFLYPESQRAVKYANHVIRILSFGDDPIPIPPDVIDALKREMLGQEVREVEHGVKVGDVVEVAEGPMRGLKGIVESIASGEDRVKVLLEFLGRQSLVNVSKVSLVNERSPRDVMASK
ncbi:transcription/translation regulatory transformer protein RfaH [soil metagenome]